MPFVRNLAEAKQRMLEHDLAARNITSPALLTALARVPRERFVPAELENAAYDDRALPIACEQTISQPYIVALMTNALELSGVESVLEIGTGSGYQTAILAELANHVVSLERHAALSQSAAATLHDLGYRNLELIVADGTEGWPAKAPYDRIIVTAAAEHCPLPLWRQLREGGQMVLPLGPPASQELVALRKVCGRPQAMVITPCRFVPLLSGIPAPPSSSDNQAQDS